MTREDQLVGVIKSAIRISHRSRKYAKALRVVEKILVEGLGYRSYDEYARWEEDPSCADAATHR